VKSQIQVFVQQYQISVFKIQNAHLMLLHKSENFKTSKHHNILHKKSSLPLPLNAAIFG